MLRKNKFSNNISTHKPVVKLLSAAPWRGGEQILLVFEQLRNI